MSIHIEHCAPDGQAATLLLVEPDGEPVRSYQVARSFRRIEHDGRTFRLLGRDRATRMMIYTPLCEHAAAPCLRASTSRVMYAGTETTDLCAPHAALVEQIEREWDQAEAEMLEQP